MRFRSNLMSFANRSCRWRSLLAFLRDAPWMTRGRLFGYSTALIAGTIAVMTWVLTGHGMADPIGRPVGTDFLRLWTASCALLNGEERSIYQPDAFFALEQAVTQPSTPDYYPWNYPPSSLLIVYPLALLPYLASFAAWTALGVGGYLAGLWRIFPKALTLWVGVAFPAVFWTVTHGQTSFLIMSLVLLGITSASQAPRPGRHLVWSSDVQAAPRPAAAGRLGRRRTLAGGHHSGAYCPPFRSGVGPPLWRRRLGRIPRQHHFDPKHARERLELRPLL